MASAIIWKRKFPSSEEGSPRGKFFPLSRTDLGLSLCPTKGTKPHVLLTLGRTVLGVSLRPTKGEKFPPWGSLFRRGKFTLPNYCWNHSLAGIRRIYYAIISIDRSRRWAEIIAYFIVVVSLSKTEKKNSSKISIGKRQQWDMP